MWLARMRAGRVRVERRETGYETTDTTAGHPVVLQSILLPGLGWRQHPVAPAENKWGFDIHGLFPESGIIYPIDEDATDERNTKHMNSIPR